MDILITECPRDAIQSWHDFIPTQAKADYINSLLKVGFEIIDIGSFVSEKAIPLLKDTAEVLSKLELSDTTSEIMVLVANAKGIETASSFKEVNWLSFPYSVSPTFLKRNINADMQQGLCLVEMANNRCEQNQKKLKVYLTMGYGNPYGDKYNVEVVMDSVAKLHASGIRHIIFGDTTGVATPELISEIHSMAIQEYPTIEFGLHLHTTAGTYYEKLDAAYQSGCRSFDSVMSGMGGCPMTGYELLNNLNTLDLLYWCAEKKVDAKLNADAMQLALKKNREVFQKISGVQFN
jgi:hydroxymethylglutaryl-CoA lyase